MWKKAVAVAVIGGGVGYGLYSKVRREENIPDNKFNNEKKSNKFLGPAFWCCTHPSHGSIMESPCTATTRQFNSLAECTQYDREHRKNNPGHSSACR